VRLYAVVVLACKPFINLSYIAADRPVARREPAIGLADEPVTALPMDP